MGAKFPLGQTVITRNTTNRLNPEEVCACLARHETGEWGELCPENVEQNECSLQEARLVSVYHDRKETKFYIITEADRSITTVLLPEDY